MTKTNGGGEAGSGPNLRDFDFAIELSPHSRTRIPRTEQLCLAETRIETTLFKICGRAPLGEPQGLLKDPCDAAKLVPFSLFLS